MTKRVLLLAVTVTVEGVAFAFAALVLGAWFFGLLPAIMGGR